MDNRARILVIEDRADVARLMEWLLNRAGVAVTVAETGTVGLQLARAGTFDLITLDIDLPDMNGYALCRRLKQDSRLWETPVVFVSSRAGVQDGAGWEACGAVDFIAKPFDASGFAERVLSRMRRTREMSTPTREMETRQPTEKR
jgi:DNA-binding response OmpR family regulator